MRLARSDPRNCIYCDEVTEKLSDEHIVPYSLGGTLILENASCASCADTTSRFEGSVARGELHCVRSQLKIKTRRKKARRSEIGIRVWLGKFGPVVDRFVPVDTAPICAIAKTYTPIDSDSDGRFGCDSRIGYRGFILDESIPDQVVGPLGGRFRRRHDLLVRKHGAYKIEYMSDPSIVANPAFERLLWKVVHCLGEAYFPRSIASTQSRDIILGRSNPVSNNGGALLVSGISSVLIPPQPAANNGVKLTTEFGAGGRIIVEIRILRQIGFPVYCISIPNFEDSPLNIDLPFSSQPN